MIWSWINVCDTVSGLIGICDSDFILPLNFILTLFNIILLCNWWIRKLHNNITNKIKMKVKSTDIFRLCRIACFKITFLFILFSQIENSVVDDDLFRLGEI